MGLLSCVIKKTEFHPKPLLLATRGAHVSHVTVRKVICIRVRIKSNQRSDFRPFVGIDRPLIGCPDGCGSDSL